MMELIIDIVRNSVMKTGNLLMSSFAGESLAAISFIFLRA